MLNMLKMDLYRMFCTRSMYVIWIVMAVVIVATTALVKMDFDAINAENPAQEEQLTKAGTEDVNVGINVELPTQRGESITVFDVFYANSMSRFYALFLVIFAVIFSTADINSGYIKNIGGQVKNRGALIVSRAAALAVFTLITMAGVFLLQAVSNFIYFREVEWGNLNAFLAYFFTESALHYALVLICMAIAVILKNNVISMVISDEPCVLPDRPVNR